MNGNFSGKNSKSYILAIMLIAASCSFQKEKTEEGTEQVVVTKEEEAHQLLASGIQQLPKWVAHWKSIEPSFDQTAFMLDKMEEYEEMEWPEENYITKDHPLYSYLFPHPTGEGVVDIYSYKVVYPEDKSPFLNPDSEVIYFKENGMRERLMFIGPSGAFEEAVWVSADYLLVAGFFENATGITPKIWLIQPKTHQFYLFNHPVETSSYPKDSYLKKKLAQIKFSDET